MGAVSEHFSNSELACHHCNVNECTQELVDALEELRTRIGRSIYITSGYRCKAHNAQIGGAPSSQHLLGNAADIRVDGMTARQVVSYVRDGGRFNGIGRSDYGQFVHADVRRNAALWCYDQHGKVIPWTA